uniref:SFRICE_013920 n=1 Tax=Spodoptera frugiperda TaxID=7108 RepID=A0A2H1WHH6_SPOFR
MIEVKISSRNIPINPERDCLVGRVVAIACRTRGLGFNSRAGQIRQMPQIPLRTTRLHDNCDKLVVLTLKENKIIRSIRVLVKH